MHIPDLNKLLAQEKHKIASHYMLENKAVELNSLLGFYSCFCDSNSTKDRNIMNTVKEVIQALNDPVLDDLYPTNWKMGVKKPKIALYANISSKHNFSISWEPLEYENREPKDFINFSHRHQSFQRPENELCFIRGLDYTHYWASVKRFEENCAFNVKDYLEISINQQVISCVELLMSSYIGKLGKNYDVWVMSNINFNKKEEPSEVKIQDHQVFTDMLDKFKNNSYVSFENANFSHPEINRTYKDETYDDIKKRCIRKINNIKDFNQELVTFNLTSEQIVDSIKNYKRKSQRIAEVLTQNTGKTITVEKLKQWVDKMHELNPEENINQFSSKPAFMDMITTMNADIEKITIEKSKKLKL